MATKIERDIGSDAGDDHASIADWVSSWPSSMVTDNEQWTGYLRDEVFPERADLTGTTTDPTRYVELTAMSSTAFDGHEGNGPEIHNNSGGTFGVVNIHEDYTRLSKFSIHQNGNTASDMMGVRFVNGSATGDIRIEKLVIHDLTGAAFYKSGTISSDITVDNCVWWECSSDGYVGNAADESTVIFSYCTGIRNLTDVGDNADAGLRDVTAKNCIMMHYGEEGHGATDNGWRDYLSIHANSTNNMSSDTSGDTGLQSDVASDVFENVTEGTEDFTLKSGSDAEDAGTSISVTDDIGGNARGASPDLGAFETQAAAATPDLPSYFSHPANLIRHV